MKHVSFSLILVCMASYNAVGQQYKIVTSIESLGFWGFDQSLIVDHDDTLDYNSVTSGSIKYKTSKRDNKNKASLEKYELTRLSRLSRGFSVEHESVAANDAMISSKLTGMAKEGWQLVFVTSAIESDAGEQDEKGVLITRYIFKK